MSENKETFPEAVIKQIKNRLSQAKKNWENYPLFSNLLRTLPTTDEGGEMEKFMFGSVYTHTKREPSNYWPCDWGRNNFSISNSYCLLTNKK